MLCQPYPAQAGPDTGQQRAGLLWNRTGLPAVFPLQVKTPAGADYFLTLTDQKTGEDALAAFIKGGAFFKVLVPPGLFVLRFASGKEWQGEDALFGPDTRHFEMPEPLEFAVRGIGGKAGHVVTLRRPRPGRSWLAALKSQSICQIARLEIPHSALLDPQPGRRLRQLSLDARKEGRLHLKRLQAERFGRQHLVQRDETGQLYTRHLPALLSASQKRQKTHNRIEPRLTQSLRSYAVRSRFCG
ncbi:hypothetical protein AB838_05305 [Rhodobacteraceae bacterium (ex Bugula neritina AB1)]|nr:hypothetical protein AB838_05305 [Rhodobacteraceae bacterium (ex Bugula neritina AB1)]